MSSQSLNLISRAEVERELSVERCLSLARVAYESLANGRALGSALGQVVAPGGIFHVKSSGLLLEERLFVSVKVVAYFEQRQQEMGLPSTVGLIQLFDGTSGQPLAVMEAEFITNVRTAAGTAVALDCLARDDAHRLLVCGAGSQTLPHVEAIAAIRELEGVTLWGRGHARAEATAIALRARLPHLAIETVDDVATAARDANLIVCLTPATTPYLSKANVRPGTTIAAIGSDTPEKRELSLDLVADSALVCDVIQQCASVGELHHALEARVMKLSDVRAEIGQVFIGTANGRMSDDEIVIFDSTGTAVQDTAPAAAVYLSTPSSQSADLWIN